MTPGAFRFEAAGRFTAAVAGARPGAPHPRVR